MKLKLVFSAATAVGLLWGTGAVYAAGGGSVYLSQTGNDQAATITQTGGTGDTVGGSGNPFLQENGTGSGGNVLTINQNSLWTGSELPTAPDGRLEWTAVDIVHTGSGNSVTGFQSGTANSAEIDQMGNNSSVALRQTGANNGAVATPGDPGFWFNGPYGNLIFQDKTANGSTVDVTQTTYKTATKGAVFNIGQGGANNTTTVTQTAHNDIWIRQGSKGSDLWAWTHPDPFNPDNTPHSLGTLSNSTITVNQSIGGTNPSGVNYAAIGQGNGSGDSIAVTQTGASNNADVNQIGSNNTFSSTQSSSNANTDWNFVGGEAGWPSSGDLLAAAAPVVAPNGDSQPITQIGNGNEYYSNQSGTNLWAFGSQIGNGNFLNNVQSGDQNALYTAQNGDYNTIYSVQDGSMNSVLVTQSHNTSYANLSQNGVSNIATVMQ